MTAQGTVSDPGVVKVLGLGARGLGVRQNQVERGKVSTG